MKVVRLSAVRTGRLYPQEVYGQKPIPVLCTGWEKVSKNLQMSNLIKYFQWEPSGSIGTKRQTERHDGAISCFRNFAKVPKNNIFYNEHNCFDCFN
jgi:hypothetical protein